MKIKGNMCQLETYDKRSIGVCLAGKATIEVSPRELLEQVTHKEIGEMLELINLPKPEVCACKEPLLVRSSHPQFYEATCGRCLLSLPPKKPKIEPLEIDMFGYVVTTASIICIVYKINEIIAVINEEAQND